MTMVPMMARAMKLYRTVPSTNRRGHGRGRWRDLRLGLRPGRWDKNEDEYNGSDHGREDGEGAHQRPSPSGCRERLIGMGGHNLCIIS